MRMSSRKRAALKRSMTPVLSKPAFRSAITNGRNIIADVDGRSALARRFRDVMQLHIADLGGLDAGLSEGQLCLVRRAACLTVHLEMMETEFAQNNGASPNQLDVYQRGANSLRRLLIDLGIHRGRIARDAKDVPDLKQYLASKANGRSHVIEHDDYERPRRRRQRVTIDHDSGDDDDD